MVDGEDREEGTTYSRILPGPGPWLELLFYQLFSWMGN